MNASKCASGVGEEDEDICLRWTLLVDIDLVNLEIDLVNQPGC